MPIETVTPLDREKSCLRILIFPQTYRISRLRCGSEKVSSTVFQWCWCLGTTLKRIPAIRFVIEDRLPKLNSVCSRNTELQAWYGLQNCSVIPGRMAEQTGYLHPTDVAAEKGRV